MNSKFHVFRIFSDIFSVFRNGEALKILMELIAEHAKTLEGRIDAVVGLESRGFLLGPHVALSLNIPFIPVRKMGKLPGELAQVEYLLEYGSVSTVYE